MTKLMIFLSLSLLLSGCDTLTRPPIVAGDFCPVYDKLTKGGFTFDDAAIAGLQANNKRKHAAIKQYKREHCTQKG